MYSIHRMMQTFTGDRTMAQVTAPQAAEIVDRDRSMVVRWVQDGVLPATRVSGRNIILINVDDLRVFARARKLRVNEELVRQYAAE
jgi:excisionase family DNA binding protein